VTIRKHVGFDNDVVAFNALNWKSPRVDLRFDVLHDGARSAIERGRRRLRRLQAMVVRDDCRTGIWRNELRLIGRDRGPHS
jgi:hypothetical protein